jgi:hypothetical protein
MRQSVDPFWVAEIVVGDHSVWIYAYPKHEEAIHGGCQMLAEYGAEAQS